jgi:hypothetical protein
MTGDEEPLSIESLLKRQKEAASKACLFIFMSNIEANCSKPKFLSKAKHKTRHRDPRTKRKR